MKLIQYAVIALCTASFALNGAILPAGESVEVKPLTYNYVVVQDFEHSVAEVSHNVDGTIKENESLSHSEHVSGSGFFSVHAAGSANTSAKRDNEYKAYKENHNYMASRYNDTVMVEKVMYSEKMTGIIESAFNEAGVSMSKSGNYVLSGSIKAMRCSKPRLVPDGSNVRYAITATTSVHIQIANKNTGKVIFAKTFTGTGQQTFNMNDPVPVDDTVDMSVNDLTASMIETLTGKKRPTEVDYQDSPGKRLVE
ncbi:hypothetical protein Sulku_1228 [Sulfuricurvum kujiense DSM 16994]|uniref:DUF4412 domain-containing protein n=1 Tax=Sulfuricurvum kujiense (strain ATCC BAA-921 / DSM 16994 / JCM 11577 / YK-1) TaxID=709032 RepID=E4TXI2_SULKY|nr:hypothetical protein [Sulfuricurvum kujiense]ADR33891.1 hypothetical protein Sulku_1228 [Sulfuricurvum kujiense DSM 16994]